MSAHLVSKLEGIGQPVSDAHTVDEGNREGRVHAPQQEVRSLTRPS